MRWLPLVVCSVSVALAWACSSDPHATLTVAPPSDAGAEAAAPDGGVGSLDLPDQPIADLPSDLQDLFDQGDGLFELPLRDGDGLGPLYTQRSCSSCHTAGARGPGSVQKMAVVQADGLTPAVDQSKLTFGHTVHPLVAGGGKTPVLPPDDPSVKVTTRVGPPVMGRGYMEAIADSEIVRMESEQRGRTDGIHGFVNWITYASETTADPAYHKLTKGDRAIGRFGLKGRVPTLDDFTADALQGDMGITSPLRPVEIPNPDGLTDDAKPGVDVPMESVHKRAMYLRLLAIPKRPKPDAAATALFARAKCDVCHAPSLKTRADYPIKAIAGVDAPLYTDMLLHDMGDKLADSLPTTDGSATWRTWRTAPLVGLRFNRTFMHDGRARSVAEAISAHDGPGSEAAESVRIYDGLSPADRKTLDDFVGGL